MKKRKTHQKKRKHANNTARHEPVTADNCITSVPTDTTLPRKKAVSAYILAGVSFLYCLNFACADQPLTGYYDALGVQKIITANALNCDDPFTTINTNNTKKLIEIEKLKLITPPKPSAVDKKILAIIKNTPMERMAAAISKREKMVAAYLVGIAMKESKFGIYSPKKNGRDCFNYWGYRGKENRTASGYSCFRSPEEAIKIVGNRIEAIVDRGADSPADMIVWKCGSTCAGHSPESVRKWIADVSIHFYQINTANQLVKK
jgi:hypothetical protein